MLRKLALSYNMGCTAFPCQLLRTHGDYTKYQKDLHIPILRAEFIYIVSPGTPLSFSSVGGNAAVFSWFVSG